MDEQSSRPSNTVGRHSRFALNAAALLLVVIGFVATEPRAQCAVVCRPIISITKVETSGVQEMQRVWTALLKVDATYCATSFGRFEMDFVRAKDVAPDMQFTEQFEWKPGEIKVSLDLWWDEVITDYRIGFVSPCVCREFQF